MEEEVKNILEKNDNFTALNITDDFLTTTEDPFLLEEEEPEDENEKSPVDKKFENDEYVDKSEENMDAEFKTCKCLPSCSSIYYDAEISQTSFDLVKYFKANNAFVTKDEEWVNKRIESFHLTFKCFSIAHAYVSIYFKEDHFIESKRTELYGWVNFLSNCGGELKLKIAFVV